MKSSLQAAGSSQTGAIQARLDIDGRHSFQVLHPAQQRARLVGVHPLLPVARHDPRPVSPIYAAPDLLSVSFTPTPAAVTAVFEPALGLVI